MALVCEREVSLEYLISGFIVGHLALQNTKTDFLIFLATLGLLAKINYIRFLYSLVATDEKNE